MFFHALAFAMPGPEEGVENRDQRPRFSTAPEGLANVNVLENNV